MKLLYIFLAHNRVGDLAELATTLVEASTDARAIIHFDLGSPQADFEELKRRVGGNERLHIVERRTRCRWGRYELVEAVVNAIREARALNTAFDHVVLLSGDCYPSKPVRQFESYLQANAGREFIECHNESWAVAGLRAERYRFYFPLHPRPNGDTAIFRGLVSLQRMLKVRRKVPRNIPIRFGSQWWVLTWETCVAVQELLDGEPELATFFRGTYIPDEMVFPSLVLHVAGEARIAGFGLTHFQFTDRGRPVVYYDDHGDFPFATSKFFIRKLSPEARALRERCLRTARLTEADQPSLPIGTRSQTYALKVRAQTYYPLPGHLFFGDQLASFPDGALKAAHSPYVVLCGERSDVRAVLDLLPDDRFHVFGFLFRPREVGLGPGLNRWRGLARYSWRVRDLHPTLYLTRVRRRVASGKVCAFGWSPGDDNLLLLAAQRDEAALVVSVPALSEDAEAASIAGMIPVDDWMQRAREETKSNSLSVAELLDDEKTRKRAFSKETWFLMLVDILQQRLAGQDAVAEQGTHAETR